MSYDHRCYELAWTFIEDEGPLPAGAHEKLAHHLAQTIQNAIECELEDLRSMFARELEG